MRISVIIPACNEERYISDTLKSIKNQQYSDFESIVVCNGCTDSTEAIAKQLATKVISIKERNVSLARNLGAENSSGDILVFQDADVQLIDPKTLTSIENILKNASVGTCKITPDIKNIKSNFACLLKNKLWFFNWTNGVIYCSKETFSKINGFNVNMTKKEDSNFIKRAKANGKYKITKNKVKLSMRRFEKKGYIKTTLFWIREFFFPSKQPYEIIR